MKKIFLLLLLFIPVFFVACGDDPVPTTTTETNYMITAKGSFWVADYYVIDSTGTRLIDTKNSMTLTIADSLSYKGKAATAMNSLSQSGSTQTSYIAVENSGKVVFEESSNYNNLMNAYFSSLGGSSATLSLGVDWVKVADADASTWQITTVPITNYEFEVMGYSATLNGDMKLSGEKKGTEEVTINGTKYTAQKFDVKIDMNADADALIFNSKVQAGKITSATTKHYWFVSNVGMIRVLQDPTIINVDIASTYEVLLPDFKRGFSGEETIVGSFKINK